MHEFIFSISKCKMLAVLRDSVRRSLFYARSYSQKITAGEWIQPNTETGHDTGIRIYNCVAGKNVPLIVRNKHCVTWYTCGPTVYDEAHIGHAICYMKCNIIQRIMQHYFQINLVTALNITDIDDKIISRSRTERVHWREIATKYESSFWDDMNALGIKKADVIVRVSDFIPHIIDFVSKLLKKEAAYVGTDGSVYFRNTRSNGKLQNIQMESTKSVSKLNDSSKSARKMLQDFALWKSIEADEPKWTVPWKCTDGGTVSTAGRPGWHTECSVMASHLFGDTVDIHAGGIDLKFPHHECEEAQSCAYHEQTQWTNYWIHIGHLVTTDNIKMSKSLKNVISVKEFLKHYGSDQLRMVCLLTSYHTHVHFSEDILLAAGNVLSRFVSFFQETQHFLENPSYYHRISNENEILAALASTAQSIDTALRNDFDTKKCIVDLQTFVQLINKSMRRIDVEDTMAHDLAANGSGLVAVRSSQNFVRAMFTVFGLIDSIARTLGDSDNNTSIGECVSNSRMNVDDLLDDIMKIRSNWLDKARLMKNNQLFEVCDQLRETINSHGIVVKDRGNNSKSTWHYNDMKPMK